MAAVRIGSQRRCVLQIALGAMLAVVTTGAPARALTVEVLAYDGQAAPGDEGLVFSGGSAYLMPALHDDGSLAWLSSLARSTGGTVAVAVFRRRPGGALELGVGPPVPSSASVPPPPRCLNNGLGVSLFAGGGVTGSGLGILAAGGYTVAIARLLPVVPVLRAGVARVPGTCDGQLLVDKPASGLRTGMGSDSGYTVYSQGNAQTIFRVAPGGGTVTIAAPGMPAPGTADTFTGLDAAFYMNQAGDIILSQRLSNGSQAIYLAPVTTDTPELIVQGGTTPAPPDGAGVITFLGLPDMAIADDGSVAFVGRPKPTLLRAVFRKPRNAALQRLDTQGVDLFSLGSRRFIDSDANLVFGGSALTYVPSAGSPQTLIASGDPVPGLPGSSFKVFQGPVLNNRGQVLARFVSETKFGVVLVSGFRCGNGILDREETCDDGNTIDGDGCDSNCTPTGCGNGILTTPEECDDGNLAPCDGCDKQCRARTCDACENTWSISWFRCDFGHENDFILERDGTPVCGSGNCPGPPGSCWSAPNTERSRVIAGDVSWTIGPSGELNVGHDRDVQVYGETFLQVASPVSVVVPLTAEVGHVWLNGVDVTSSASAGSIGLDLQAGWNHLEWTSYNQHDGTSFALNFPFAQQVEQMRCALTACGDGVVGESEQCDDGNLAGGDCCSPTCEYEPSTMVCRPSVSACDQPELCTGTNGVCPVEVDMDGDGTSDDCDTCPAVFNPDQLDSDAQDGGDVCDPCPRDALDQCDPLRSASATVGPAGATLTTPDGSIDVTIPPGALSAPRSGSITGGLPDSRYMIGSFATRIQVAELGPDGQVFLPPATITFSWPDADNDGRVDGTVLSERALLVWRNGKPLTGQCWAKKHQPSDCTTACCRMDLNIWTLQVDQFSEYVVAEQPCVEVDGAQLKLTKLDTPAGDDGLVFKGSFTLPPGIGVADVDPLVHGLGLTLDDQGPVVDVTLPAGAFDESVGRGWVVKSKGRRWIYAGESATSPGGIVKAVLEDRSKKAPGLVKFLFESKGGFYAASPQVVSRVVLPASGDCAEARFPGPPGPSCALSKSASTLKCEE